MYKVQLLLVSCFFLAIFSLVNSKPWPYGAGKLRSLKLQNVKDIAMPRQLAKSEGQGGEGGVAFNDMEQFSSAGITGIRSINISSGDQVNSIEVEYILANNSLLKAPVHGSSTAQAPVSITLAPEEQIVRIEGKTSGVLLDQLTIFTMDSNYKKRVYGPFGKTGTQPFEFDGQPIAFFGSSGDLMNSIGVYYLDPLKMSDQYGGSQENNFDDFYELNFPPVVGIRNISVWFTDAEVTGFQVEYILLNGSLLLGLRHGNQPGTNPTTILFEDEILVALEGKVIKSSGGPYEDRIGQLTFITLKGNGEPGMYGPYGQLGTQPFTITGNIVSFFGSAGESINRIGAYYV